MKFVACLGLLLGVIVLADGYTPFRNWGNQASNLPNYTIDNRHVGLGSRIQDQNQRPGQRRGPYGGEYVSSTSPFEIVYEWKIFDYEYPSTTERRAAIASG